ncbi:MAG: tRNA (adenosine(37)-N6)-threonylcarbamoyltransferase complex ATPase subunit type 1 TsaE [Phycisphaerales bacterium]
MSTWTHTAQSAADTEALAAALAAQLKPGMVLALTGDLGAGKTCFVRGLARGLGHAADQVSSPTFVIEHRYRAPGAVPLAHLDAYRLQTAADLAGIGWEELLDSQQAIIAVEWADRITHALPAHTVWIALEHAPHDARQITVRGLSQPGLGGVSGAAHQPS